MSSFRTRVDGRGAREAFAVESYIAAAPQGAREKIRELGSLVRRNAPAAKETISYGMPYYKLNGPLVGFAACKDHVSLFGSIPDELRGELRNYRTGRGSIQFPFDEPLPSGLIARIVRWHLRQTRDDEE